MGQDLMCDFHTTLNPPAWGRRLRTQYTEIKRSGRDLPPGISEDCTYRDRSDWYL